jgi:hypothetical protein
LEDESEADDGFAASEDDDGDGAETGDSATGCEVLLMTVVCVMMLVTCWIEVDEDEDEAEAAASLPAAANCATDDEGDTRGVVDLRGRMASMAVDEEERDEGVMALVVGWIARVEGMMKKKELQRRIRPCVSYFKRDSEREILEL